MNMQTSPIPEERLKQAVQKFQYPATPDVAGDVMKRLEVGNRPRFKLRSAWLLTGLLILTLAVLFAVPSVRAEIVRFFQVGVVHIFPTTGTPTAIPTALQTPLVTMSSASPTSKSTNTPFPYQPEPLYSVTASGLAGETSLEDAQASLRFVIKLPQYPADLGAPDRVFMQEDGGMVILVWGDPADSEQARLSLHEISMGSVIVGKFEPRVIQETQVEENYAVWVQGPYLVQLSDGTYNWRRLVAGNTLIWEEDEITYRLESDLILEETIRIAESLR